MGDHEACMHAQTFKRQLLGYVAVNKRQCRSIHYCTALAVKHMLHAFIKPTLISMVKYSHITAMTRMLNTRRPSSINAVTKGLYMEIIVTQGTQTTAVIRLDLRSW